MLKDTFQDFSGWDRRGGMFGCSIFFSLGQIQLDLQRWCVFLLSVSWKNSFLSPQSLAPLSLSHLFSSFTGATFIIPIDAAAIF